MVLSAILIVSFTTSSDLLAFLTSIELEAEVK